LGETEGSHSEEKEGKKAAEGGVGDLDSFQGERKRFRHEPNNFVLAIHGGARFQIEDYISSRKGEKKGSFGNTQLRDYKKGPLKGQHEICLKAQGG